MANVDKKNYRPAPIDTADVVLPTELLELGEQIARNNHEVWAVAQVLCDNSRHGGIVRTGPQVPHRYADGDSYLPDIQSLAEVLKVVVKLGFKISKE